ncbi:MAG: MSCRAMM family protein [Planctomycetota bacterium]|jgi:hypothetical protein
MSRSLPSDPSLVQLKKQAKDLLKAHGRGDRKCCKTLRLLRRFADAGEQEILAADLALHEAQFALAMDYGFKSWAELKAHAEVISGPSGPTRDVTVLVTDTNGRKVSGATVGAIAFSHLGAEDAVTADGVAILRLPEGSDFGGILALKAGVGFDYWKPPDRGSRIVVGPTTPPRELHVVLDGAKTVRVRVEGSDGKPVAGVSVWPTGMKKYGKEGEINLSGCLMTRVETDERGVAKFDWIPRRHVGTTGFYIRGDYEGYAVGLDGTHPDGTELVAKAVKLTRLSGKVVFPDGSPAGGIRVQFQGRGRSIPGIGYIRTGADGRYSAQLKSEQSYVVAVIDDDWAAESRCGILIRENRPRDGVDLKLIKGTVIKGRLTVGEKREPVAGANIVLVQRGKRLPWSVRTRHVNSGEFVRGVRTDEKGRYSFRVGPGRYRLREPSSEEEIDLRVRGEPEIIRDIHRPLPARGVLTGLVTGRDDGKPAAGAIARGWSAVRTHVGFTAECDEDGRFAVERWHDKMMVWAHSPDGTMAGCAEIGAAAREVHVAIEPAVLVEAKVVDEDGRALARHSVLYRMRFSYADGTGDWFRVETAADESGALRMPGMIPGAKCRVWAVRGIMDRVSRIRSFTAGSDGKGKMRLPDIRCRRRGSEPFTDDQKQ